MNANTGRDTKVALITGSGRRRIGSHLAEHLARHGYAIALHYHQSATEAAVTMQELHRRNVDCAGFAADVCEEDQVDAMFEQVLARFGRLDLLVTTASMWSRVSLEEVKASDCLKNWQVDTLGTFLCARRAGLIMAQQASGGAIITVGDWAIERPYRDYSPYFLAKGAMPTLTKTLAVELAARNPKVRVNCVLPGPVLFPPGTTPREQETLIESTLVKMANCPDALAHAIQALAENEFITGAILPVDGGRTIYSAE